MQIDLEIEDLAAALIAERAARDARTGARSLRPIFSNLVNPFEFDPWAQPTLEPAGGGRHRLRITADLVRESLAR